MIVSVAAGENRLTRTAEKSLTQRLVALQRRLQIRTAVIAGRVFVELGAVADHSAFKVFVEQAEAFDQGMNCPQRAP